MEPKRKEAYDFLTSHKFAVLSTADKDGRPWGATIYYIVDEDFNFYFFTRAQSKKYRNIQERPEVAITISDNGEQTTVQAAGMVSEVPLGPEHDHAFRLLSLIHPPGQFEWIPPVTKIQNGEMLLLKLAPQHMRFSDFKSNAGQYATDIIPQA